MREQASGGLGWVLTAVYWATLVSSILFLQDLYASVLGSLLDGHSEYKLVEQGTKFLLLLLAAVALLACRDAAEPRQARLSAVTLLLALLIYAGESNFLNVSLQPAFAGPLLLLLLIDLLRTNRAAAAMHMLGCTVIALGMFGDVTHDHPGLLPPWPLLQRAGGALSRVEEYCDLLGIAGLVFAGLLAFRTQVLGAVRRTPGRAALLLLAVGLVAFGNGFMHHQYHPNPRVQVPALLAAMLGCGLLVALYRPRVDPAGRLLPLGRVPLAYNLVLGFVLLPVIYQDQPNWMAAILWGPIVLLAGLYLLRKPPENPHAAVPRPIRTKQKGRIRIPEAEVMNLSHASASEQDFP